MNSKVFFLFLFFFVFSQVEQDEEAESAIVPEGDLEIAIIETEDDLTYTVIMDYSEENVNITQSLMDAKQSIGSYTMEQSKENLKLFAENQMLLEEISEIEEVLKDSVEKTVSFRVGEAAKLKELADEMAILGEFNDLITEEPETIENTVNDSSAEEDDEEVDEDLELNHAFLFVLGLSFVFILLFTLKSSSESLVFIAFQPAIHSLLVNLCILTLLIAIVSLLNYLKIVNEEEVYIETIYTGIVLFTFIWFFLGIWLIFASQFLSLTWEKSEKSLIDEDPSEKNMDFAVMRTLFITNPYLPVASEYSLRPDFYFADYLRRCLGNTLKSLFSLNWLGFFIVLICIILWRLVLELSESSQVLVLWAAPVVFLSISASAFLKIRKIVKMLISSTGNHLKIQYDYNSNAEVPVPLYLKGHIPPPNDSFQSCSIYFLKCTCSYIFLGVYPNRHQLLFWFDCYGPKFMLSLIQAVCAVLSLWLTVILLYYLPILHDSADELGIGLLITGFLVFFLMAGGLIPLWIRYFTIATSVEMMKNNEFIKETVENTQGSRLVRNKRLFIQFKSLWRDMLRMENMEKLEKLPTALKSLAKEAFDLEATNGFLHCSLINSALLRLGVDADSDLFRVFLKDCEMESDDTISSKNFLLGLQRLLQDQHTKPKKVVTDVLKYHIKNIKVKLTELADFLDENKWFMQDNDIKEFLVDLHFYLDENGMIDLNELEFNN